jgi:hypothetical protein
MIKRKWKLQESTCKTSCFFLGLFRMSIPGKKMLRKTKNAMTCGFFTSTKIWLPFRAGKYPRPFKLFHRWW